MNYFSITLKEELVKAIRTLCQKNKMLSLC
uniref:Uncharacterized protein n=1 Tax=Rhizophora mucronata TaxID=61149 RepID=A0A2P2QY45_RHIMU